LCINIIGTKLPLSGEITFFIFWEANAHTRATQYLYSVSFQEEGKNILLNISPTQEDTVTYFCCFREPTMEKNDIRGL
jgi:hypothetical protein